MGKVIVFELKRLVPFLLLLILLAGLSFYDYMSPHVRETGAIKDEDKFEMQLITESNQEELNFMTKEQGYRSEPSAFQVIETDEQWQKVSQRNNLGVSKDYFNQGRELGIFAFNSEILEIRHVTLDDKEREKEIVQLEIKTTPVQDFYHVVVIDRNDIIHGESKAVNWRFTDTQGNILSEFMKELP